MAYQENYYTKNTREAEEALDAAIENISDTATQEALQKMKLWFEAVLERDFEEKLSDLQDRIQERGVHSRDY